MTIDNWTNPITAFGAVGDGTTDNKVAFDNAMSWINGLNGRVLLIPPGNFAKSGSHSVTSNNSAVIGSGGVGCQLTQLTSEDNLIIGGGNDICWMPQVRNLSFWRQLGTFGTDLKILACASFLADNIVMPRVSKLGLDIMGSGGLVSNITLLEESGLTGEVDGSALLRIENHIQNGTSVHSTSELSIVNFNIKGNNGNLTDAIHITGCDGVMLANGHCGFCAADAMFINPVAASNSSVQSVLCNNVYFDGNRISYSAFRVDSKAPGNVAKIQCVGCTFALARFHGIQIEYPVINSIFNDNVIVDNKGWGIVLNGGSKTYGNVFDGNRIANNTMGTVAGNADRNTKNIFIGNNTI